MTPGAWASLLGAAALAGLFTALVGGGSFIAFPALLLIGVPPVNANATTAFLLTPAAAASAFAYRAHLTQPRRVILAFVVASVVGGEAGALLLLRTPESTFVGFIPWLLLFASALFTFGGRLVERLGVRPGRPLGTPLLALGTAVQLVISIYGGYFGGGMGIMMLAAWTLLGMTDLLAMNGLRTLVGALLNGVAVLSFVGAGAVAYRPGLPMLVVATAAGYAGAAVARRIDPRLVRGFVIAVAWGMTAWFFYRRHVG